MDEIKFNIQVSNDTPHYTVTISKEKKRLTASCTCESGGPDTLCKHRLSILAGKAKWVISNNTAEVKHVLSWAASTGVGDAIVRMVRAQKRLKDTEQELIKATHNREEAEQEAITSRQELIQALSASTE
ncbi:MAG: hypothetical protein HQL80_01275 [Magnetococcales bacterium]|nr:hypothetical protein [Magnetococcales bacterium]